MKQNKWKNKRLTGLFLLGILLFNYPIISLFNLDTMLLGFPLLYLYLFSTWGFLILLIVIIMEKASGNGKADTIFKKPQG